MCIRDSVERVSRYTILVPLPGKRTADALNTALTPVLLDLPEYLSLSLTWDQGKEIAGHQALATSTGVDVYVCEPHSPWQRGTNENTNGLVRQWFPKSTNFYALDPAEIDAAAIQLNNRPRRTLHWRTPDQVMQSHHSKQQPSSPDVVAMRYPRSASSTSVVNLSSNTVLHLSLIHI